MGEPQQTGEGAVGGLTLELQLAMSLLSLSRWGGSSCLIPFDFYATALYNAGTISVSKPKGQ